MKYKITALSMIILAGCTGSKIDPLAQEIHRELSNRSVNVLEPDHVYSSVTFLWKDANGGDVGDSLYFLKNQSLPFTLNKGETVRDFYGSVKFEGVVDQVTHDIQLNTNNPESVLWHNIEVTFINSTRTP